MKNQFYPLKFEPLYQYRIWGGRRLEKWIAKPLPKDETIGEAWILSDRKDHASKVTEGPLKGTTLTDLMQNYPKELMGKHAHHFDRFPLLLKFLDCNAVLSVQVHPSDDQTDYIPEGDTGKTEAWVVLETSDDSKIYAGLKEGTTKEGLIKSIENKTVADKLHSFKPEAGDAVFIHSGTVHTLGGAVVFEVQENSDVTFRLYDWDRVDKKTGKPRDLQIDEALACIDFDRTNVTPVPPEESLELINAEILFDNNHFKLWRMLSQTPVIVGFDNEPVILVCIDGKGTMEYENNSYSISKGEVMVLPAAVGQLQLNPVKEITVLQIAIPQKSTLQSDEKANNI